MRGLRYCQQAASPRTLVSCRSDEVEANQARSVGIFSSGERGASCSMRSGENLVSDGRERRPAHFDSTLQSRWGAARQERVDLRPFGLRCGRIRALRPLGSSHAELFGLTTGKHVHHFGAAGEPLPPEAKLPCEPEPSRGQWTWALNCTPEPERL